MLNLGIGDITLKVLQYIFLFGILNGCAVFIRESDTRMDVWRTMNSRVLIKEFVQLVKLDGGQRKLL